MTISHAKTIEQYRALADQKEMEHENEADSVAREETFCGAPAEKAWPPAGNTHYVQRVLSFDIMQTRPLMMFGLQNSVVFGYLNRDATER
ncbi:unnamed protein product [Nippostrongylus brasiliensis]|uniref:ABC transporter n=1 Tax=Nippostrongylus brasiliensis TaxID=27835 RepID=A0A0N4Y6A7_NIPBR|nr:unnamed protein product [Nippostrongylus brasiliensis]